MKTLKSYLRGMILLGIILLLTFFQFSTALAYTAGPLSPGLGSNVPGIGSEPWLNPNDVTTPGSPYASVTLYQDHRTSNYLQGTQYSFDIAPEMEILGIELTVNRMSNSANFYDNEVKLVRGGTVVGENKADTVNAWPNTFKTSVYGGPTDLWGQTWTPADINAHDFGVALVVFRSDNGANLKNAEVDSLQITIYYGYSTLTSLECGDGSPVVYGDNLLCVMTVSRVAGNMTPGGSVNWSTDGSGTFDPNPCTLSGTDGVATCSAVYTPDEVGSGTHLITASYSGDDYFPPNEASQPVTVTTRPITVTADPKSKTVGQPDPELTYQLTVGSLLDGDAFTGELSRQPGETVGTYAILQGTLSLPDYYDLTFVGADFTILNAIYWFPMIFKLN
jgi:hypothetical protein